MTPLHPDVGLYAPTECSDLVFPSALREAVVTGQRADGTEIWRTQAASTRTLIDGLDVYTASAIRHWSIIGSLLISCYFMTPDEDRGSLREAMEQLFPAQHLPDLAPDGTSYDNYDDWGLDGESLTAYLSDSHAASHTPTQTTTVHVVTPGGRRSFDTPTFVHSGKESLFRLLVARDTVIGQVTTGQIGRGRGFDLPILELSHHDARDVEARPRR